MYDMPGKPLLCKEKKDVNICKQVKVVIYPTKTYLTYLCRKSKKITQPLSSLPKISGLVQQQLYENI